MRDFYFQISRTKKERIDLQVLRYPDKNVCAVPVKEFHIFFMHNNAFEVTDGHSRISPPLYSAFGFRLPADWIFFF